MKTQHSTEMICLAPDESCSIVLYYDVQN
jgi:hypothetical protein